MAEESDVYWPEEEEEGKGDDPQQQHVNFAAAGKITGSAVFGVRGEGDGPGSDSEEEDDEAVEEEQTGAEEENFWPEEGEEVAENEVAVELQKEKSETTSFERSETYKRRITRLYQQYQPDALMATTPASSGVSLLEAQLREHRGREEEFIAKLVQRYGPEPLEDEPLAVAPPALPQQQQTTGSNSAVVPSSLPPQVHSIAPPSVGVVVPPPDGFSTGHYHHHHHPSYSPQQGGGPALLSMGNQYYYSAPLLSHASPVSVGYAPPPMGTEIPQLPQQHAPQLYPATAPIGATHHHHHHQQYPPPPAMYGSCVPQYPQPTSMYPPVPGYSGAPPVLPTAAANTTMMDPMGGKYRNPFAQQGGYYNPDGQYNHGGYQRGSP